MVGVCVREKEEWPLGMRQIGKTQSRNIESHRRQFVDRRRQ
jgi:hypothetical protein